MRIAGITQQQPASRKFARQCGWAKVEVNTQATTLYSKPNGKDALGMISRLSQSGEDIYLERFSSFGSEKRLRVRVVGATKLNGRVGWVDEDDIESAGEKCSEVYSLN